MIIFSSIEDVLKDKLKLSSPIVKQVGMTKNDIKKVIRKYRKVSEKEGKYLVLATKWAEENLLNVKDDKERETLFNMYKEYDDIGFIPLEEGKFLEYLTTFASVGIYYIKSSLLNDDITNDKVLNSIFTTGLETMLNLSSDGIQKKDDESSKTIFPANNPFEIVFRLKGKYKDSNGAVIVLFKQGIVDENFDLIDASNEEILNDVYDYNIVPYIKPTHLFGYVSLEDGICKFYEKDLFTKQNKVLQVKI